MSFPLGVCIPAALVGAVSGLALFRAICWLDARSVYPCSPVVLRAFSAVMALATIYAVALAAAASANGDAWGGRTMLRTAICGGIPALIFGAGLGQRARRR